MSIANPPQQDSWLKLAGKTVAVAATTGAAVISVITALYSHGFVGKADAHQSIGNLGAAWVRVQPSIETATAIGDTSHFVATIADRNGSILIGARPTWTASDTTVATVLQDGSVIARGPGATIVTVVVGPHVAQARFRVRQEVATVEIAGASGDSGVVVAEGSHLHPKAVAIDGRGHAIVGARIVWTIDDTSVAALDSSGTLMGRAAGRTILVARSDDVVGNAGLTVVTTASAIALVAGTEQRALAGATLPQQIVVRAISRRGAPAAGALVTFTLPSGLGAVEPATSVTDADGRARATWTLGEIPGRQTLLASVESVDTALAVVAEADPVATNTRIESLSDHLSGRAGERLGDMVAVRVTDSTGRAVVDVPVRWSAIDGGAVDVIAARTDSLGVARAHWTLARKTGTQRLRAEVGGSGARIAPVTIDATSLAGSAVGVVVVRGDKQHGRAGTDLAKPVVIKVVDAYGNGVADAEVILSPSGGAVPDSAPRTDALGVVRTAWRMGREARSYSLAVHVAGVKALTKLSAAAAPGPPANLSFDDAPASASKAGTKRISAVVTDVYGNPVADAKLRFIASSGVVRPMRAVSDGRGRATLQWTLRAKPAEQTLTGAVEGRDVTGAYVTQVVEHLSPTPKAATIARKQRGKSGA